MEIKIYFNEIEYLVSHGKTVFEVANVIGETFIHIDYLNHFDELIDSSLALVEIEGHDDLVNPFIFYVEYEMKIKSINEKIIKRQKNIIEEISKLDEFKCFVSPLNEELTTEARGFLESFYCMPNYESGFFEYYNIEEVNYTEEIKKKLTSSDSHVVLLVDANASEVLKEPMLEMLKEAGFKDIITTCLGQKVKAIEEVDYLIKEASEKLDGGESTLPMITTDDPELTAQVIRAFPELINNLSNVKYSFQIEANIYKKNFDNNIYVVYLTTCKVTNANADLFINEDIDSVLLISQIEELVDAVMLSSGEQLTTKEEKRTDQTSNLLIDLIVPSFYELIFKQVPACLAVTKNNNSEEVVIKHKKGSYVFLVTTNIDSLNDLMKEKTLIELTSCLPNRSFYMNSSIYEDLEVNNIYQSYLKVPGSTHIKREQ